MAIYISLVIGYQCVVNIIYYISTHLQPKPRNKWIRYQDLQLDYTHFMAMFSEIKLTIMDISHQSFTSFQCSSLFLIFLQMTSLQCNLHLKVFILEMQFTEMLLWASIVKVLIFCFIYIKLISPHYSMNDVITTLTKIRSTV